MTATIHQIRDHQSRRRELRFSKIKAQAIAIANEPNVLEQKYPDTAPSEYVVPLNDPA